ncbi:cysteine hydrolase family protein [Tepidibacter mesophilus]|uniref:cysteine hydrolase family protein n=1 Tax=Tepidibacter mesophilus TaxID=655607 RepID=UPI000C07C1EF|nr:cysteine hydrolase family protein [Tepidibacter mesophilus]
MNKKTALLIVDAQFAMFCDENNKLHEEEGVLNNIYTLLRKARKTKTPIIFIQHTEDRGEYKKGTKTWEIHPKIAPIEGELVIEKHTWDSFHQTSLHETLQKKGIDELVIVGMQTEFCLDTTCRRAFSMGYKNTLVKDAHSTFDSEDLKAYEIINHHNRVLGGRFVQLKYLDHIDF